MDRGSWQATVYGVAKELDMTEHTYTHTHTHRVGVYLVFFNINLFILIGS